MANVMRVLAGLAIAAVGIGIAYGLVALVRVVV
jgi:hypothetical protein